MDRIYFTICDETWSVQSSEKMQNMHTAENLFFTLLLYFGLWTPVNVVNVQIRQSHTSSSFNQMK